MATVTVTLVTVVTGHTYQPNHREEIMPLSFDTMFSFRHDLTSDRPVIRAGHWRIERPDSDPFVGTEYELWHHSTRMLHWRESKRNGIELLSLSLGHGSVSDQGGMNRAFRALGASHLYYSRAGGAGIINQEER
jgi:hypothetical protein